jgi:DNA polymerase-1
MTRPDGTPVNAVYGFTSMLMKLIEETDADHIAVIFDKARRTFRNDLYAEYKANRPEPPEELIPQFALVREATRAFSVGCVDLEGFEADDLIASYARETVREGGRVTIVSSDKDLMQLVGDGIEMLDPIRNRIIGPDEVREKFGVGPERVIDVQALAGDAADNVPGVPGIGVKTAAALICEYGDLETLLARAAEIKQPKRRQALLDHAEAARLSLKLVRLDENVPLPEPLSSFAVRPPDPEKLLDFLREQSFRSLIARVESRVNANGNATPRAQANLRPSPPGPATAVLERPDAPAAAQTARPGPQVATGKAHHELVTDLPALQRWVNDATAAGAVAVDTETTSLNSMRARLVGVSLGLEGRACYIPLAHRSGGDQGALDFAAEDRAALPDQIPLDCAIEALRPLLSDPSVLKIGQNIKYDMQVLAHYGIEVTPVDDTMLISYVLEGGLHGHGMDELAQLVLGHDTIKYKDVTGTGKSQITFDLVPLDKALAYAAEDADVTWRLHNVLKPRLVENHMVTVYETLERPLIAVLERMERTGIRVDSTELRRLSDDFERRLADLADQIFKLAGHPFNIGSPKQLGEVLFDELALQGGKKGKTGAYVTSADVLDELALLHDLPARVLDWRQLAKLKSTYADALVNQIHPDTGRVHTCYGMAAASTGRLASTDPNLQNIPIRTEEGRKIRRAFVPDDGCKLVSADYSQIELRLLAHVAGIDALKDAFRAGHDIHALTASEVFGVPLAQMDPVTRRKAKAINFGIIYGISPFGLARQLGIGRGEAAAYIDAYFQRFPGIRAYMEDTKTFARKNGFVQTLFGRKCHIPGINDRNPAQRGFSERAAINAPLQGGAADIIKRAMVRVPRALEANGLGARMLLQVHDELVFEVPVAEVEATKALVKGVMERAASLDVPLVVDTGAGDNWDEAH